MKAYLLNCAYSISSATQCEQQLNIGTNLCRDGEFKDFPPEDKYFPFIDDYQV